MTAIGQAIKENRKRIGLTQIQLAEYANVSPKFIVELERGKETVQLDKVRDVLNVLDLTIAVIGKKEASRE